MNYTKPKRRNDNGPSKPSSDVTPAKVRKKEVLLEKLTKQQVIDQYKKLEAEYLGLVNENKKKEDENIFLNDKIKQLEGKLNPERECRSIQSSQT